jgi:tetratricopeptide (TPR) repeat protein
MNTSSKKRIIAAGLVLWFAAAVLPRLVGAPLANENSPGLYVRSIEQMMRLGPDEIDIGTAALIVAEEWSDIVHGRRYQFALDEMAYEIQARINEKGLAGSYRAAYVLNEYLHKELGYQAVKEATDPNDLFLHSVMDNRRGYCLSLSILYLALGERLGLPLHGVVAPGHFFVRYEDGRVRFNIETTTGAYPDDEYYRKEFKTPEGHEQSLYMQNLNKLQTLGCLFNNFGTVYLAVGNLDAAQRAMELAVEINPTLAESRANLGNIYLRKDRVDDAIYEYRRAIEINPSGGKVYHNLGNAYSQKGWVNDAMGAYEQAIRLDPNYVDAYINLAVIYGQTQMYAKAQQMLVEAASIDPGRGDIYVKRGDTYFLSREYDRALEEYNTALRINRSDAAAHFGTALCYNKLDMPKNEIQSYQQALKIEPGLLAARANLGNAYFARKDYAKAIKQYQAYIRIEPDNETIHYNIGAAYSNLEKYAEAAPYYEKALELQPQMADAHRNLGYAYYRLKKYKQAYEHLTAARQLGAELDPKLLKAVERKLR